MHWSCGESVSWQMWIGIFICRRLKCWKTGIKNTFGTGNSGAHTGTWRHPHCESVFRLSECTLCFSETGFSLADSLPFHVKAYKVNSIHLGSWKTFWLKLKFVVLKTEEWFRTGVMENSFPVSTTCQIWI